MIQVDRLEKSYGPLRALDGLSFQARSGEILGLVGKNGAGKTTVLKILSGQLLPSAGHARVDGLDVVSDGLAVRRRIGYLPEAPPLYPEMTVTGYLRFCAGLRGLTHAQAGARLPEVLGLAGLESVAGTPLRHLSRGFQQRVGIAQAIVHDPAVVLLDEPMAGLDPLQIVQTRDLIRGLKPRHTVVFSSHILGEIASLCDRIVLMDRGRVRAEGTEEELWSLRTRARPMLLRLRADAEVALRALRKIKGAEVAPAPQGHAVAGEVWLRVAHQEDVRERISRACVEAGLGLLEQRLEGEGLEELFVQLVGDGPGKMADDAPTAPPLRAPAAQDAAPRAKASHARARGTKAPRSGGSGGRP
jgi:ABC-2 type transport system ATP-binding protein